MFQIQAFACRAGGDPLAISQFDFKPNSVEVSDRELRTSMGGEVSGPGGYLLVYIEVFQILSVLGGDIILLFEVVHFKGTLQRREGLTR